MAKNDAKDDARIMMQKLKEMVLADRRGTEKEVEKMYLVQAWITLYEIVK